MSMFPPDFAPINGGVSASGFYLSGSKLRCIKH